MTTYLFGTSPIPKEISPLMDTPKKYHVLPSHLMPISLPVHPTTIRFVYGSLEVASKLKYSKDTPHLSVLFSFSEMEEPFSQLEMTKASNCGIASRLNSKGLFLDIQTGFAQPNQTKT